MLARGTRTMDRKVTPPEVDPPKPDEEQDDLDEAMPRVQITRRRLVLGVLFVVAAVAFLYFVLPQLADLREQSEQVGEGNRRWLGVAFVFTVASFGGYVMMFQGIFVRAGTSAGARIDWRASYQITMAGLAATRLFATGGAGGIALTAWALRRAGMPRRKVADKTLAFLILTYAVYMAALVICGFGLYYDLLPGPGPFAITLIPAVFALLAIAAALGLSRVPPDLQRRLEGFARRGGRLARIAQRLSNAPAAFSAGMREAIVHLRQRDPALLGAVAWVALSLVIFMVSALVQRQGVDDEAGSVTVTSHKGTQIVSKAVLITGGIGTFTPRPLPDADEFEGRGLRYFVPKLDELEGHPR
ncbi:MAG: flippase-like domain-containing protein [Actinobacteria bacterium]|nr:flippase-like domain-containing protein [Actinomycetota bacterium]